jgi:ubiquinone/menaquinone biosynthesis C-methylase UbiE
MLSTLDKLAYTARQGARVAWYMGHGIAAGQFRKTEPGVSEVTRERPRQKGPGLERLLRELANTFQRDLDNVAAGHYPLPRDADGSPGRLLRTSRAFLADVPVAAERKAKGEGTEVYSPDKAEELPAYFLQNFHYQTGGYLTEDSAEIYDMQTEVLFSGSTNAMRRECLVPLAHYMKGKDQRKVKLADIACGTGRFGRFIKQAYPRIDLTLFDLSDAYLGEAKRHLRDYTGVQFEAANAERLPFADNSLDVLTSIYLFHEVPPKVRRIIAVEFARVLKPGGRLIFMDSLQLGDVDGFDGMLQSFPVNFHEPYYGSYIKEDLAAIFGEAGLNHTESRPVFLSKLVVCDKPS